MRFEGSSLNESSNMAMYLLIHLAVGGREVSGSSFHSVIENSNPSKGKM